MPDPMYVSTYLDFQSHLHFHDNSLHKKQKENLVVNLDERTLK